MAAPLTRPIRRADYAFLERAGLEIDSGELEIQPTLGGLVLCGATKQLFGHGGPTGLQETFGHQRVRHFRP